MRTTLNLNDSLLREAKKRAAQEGRTLTALFEEALRLFLTRRRGHRPYRLRWPVRRGGGTARRRHRRPRRAPGRDGGASLIAVDTITHPRILRPPSPLDEALDALEALVASPSQTK